MSDYKESQRKARELAKSFKVIVEGKVPNRAQLRRKLPSKPGYTKKQRVK